MIAIQSNFSEVAQAIIAKMSAIDIDKMTRIQATTLMAVMRDRIHVQGLDADGNPIGTYSPKYVKYVRNSKKYERGSDTKVIASLTRTLENSWRIYPIQNGTGIGFTTAEQLKKSGYVQETYKKDIFAPTQSEIALANEIAHNYISKHFKQ